MTTPSFLLMSLGEKFFNSLITSTNSSIFLLAKRLMLICKDGFGKQREYLQPQPGRRKRPHAAPHRSRPYAGDRAGWSSA